MIAEWGSLALIIALMFSLLLAIVPTIGLIYKKDHWIQAANVYVYAQCLFVGLAWLALTICFLHDDFTIRYVLSHSSIALPWFYKMCAVWGGHEGSMLLWVAIITFWMMMVAAFSKSLEHNFRTRVLVIMGLLSAGFLLFILTTSNPFLRQFVLLNTEGKDLNPLLQDPGFLFHPPMLYMGYAGFSVTFAFAVAALWEGRMESPWSRWARPWVLGSWSCLTAGITLGSWWAYRELGWGGWWFWDPVENASFMPWLVGTALLHSLAVAEKKQQFKAWTLLLSIMAFSLSLIGTFLVRSGVLTSVHAFAVDPQRGLYILGFLSVVIGGSLLLFAIRAHQLKNDQPFELVSRESALLLNNVFLVVIMLSVLLGTLYPLLIDSLHLGKLSVGPPYFNAIFVPLFIPILVLMGIGMHLHWKKDTLALLLKRTYLSLILAFLIPFLIIWNKVLKIDFSIYLGAVLATWVILTTLTSCINRIQQQGFFRISLAFWGMVVAHIGVAITVLGVVLSNGYGTQKDVQMAPGDKVQLAGHVIQFVSTMPLKGANYIGTQTEFIVTKHLQSKSIFPEKRIYNIGQMAMTESAIDVTPFRDIYVALGEPIGDRSWSVRLYYKPFVRGIWAGGFLLLLGGGLALADRRYYKKSRVQSAEEVIV